MVCVPYAALYDSVSGGYTVTRGTDPQLAQAIWAGLGDAGSVLNVGPGRERMSHRIARCLRWNRHR